MKIHKPDDLALLYRVLRWQGCDVLSIGAICGFRLTAQAKAPLLSEVDIWQLAARACEDAPLDEGLPKPSGEFLLMGTAHAPAGQPVPHLPVSARVGDVKKQLFCFGDRHTSARGSLSTPAPFIAMPLAGNGGPIPNIEDPAHRIVSSSDTPPSAGFGPLPPDDAARVGLLGPFDAPWHAREWPHLPVRTLPAYAHVARPDQRSARFWRGDEAVELVHLVAGHPLLASQLPSLRARCFVRRQVGTLARFEEIPAQAETVWLLPDFGCGLVLYRAVAALADEDGDDVLDVVAGWESMHEGPRATAEYEAILFPPTLATVPEAPPLSEEAGAPTSAPLSPAPEQAPEQTPQVDLTGLDAVKDSVAALEQDAEAMLRHAGLTRAELEQHLPVSSVDPPLDLAALTAMANDFERQAQSLAAAHGVTPEMIAAHLEAGARTAPEQSVSEALTQLESDVAAMRASLRVTPEIMNDLTARYPELPALMQAAPPMPQTALPPRSPEPASAEEPQKFAPPIPVAVTRHTRESVIAAHAAGQRLAGMDLGGLDLGALSLTGADFSGANLVGASFEGTDLTSALLRNARCAGARFVNAQLDGAQLQQGDFVGADFSAASMAATDCAGALFDAACMTSLRANACVAPGASFADCTLTDADFANANLRGARFHRSLLVEASFIDAECHASEWYGAIAERARFTRAQLQRSRSDATSNFREADFCDARLDHANWDGAELCGALLNRAVLDGADLSRVQGRGARLSQASARGTLFDKADLLEADLSQVNLFRGSLRRALLSRASLEGTHLFSVDAYGADFSGACLSGATTTRTVLSCPERAESMTVGTPA